MDNLKIYIIHYKGYKDRNSYWSYAKKYKNHEFIEKYDKEESLMN